MNRTCVSGQVWPRRQFLAAAGAVGASVAVRPMLSTDAHRAPATQTCRESIQDILNTALIAEQLATTFYYTGLSTPNVMRDTRTAGSSGDPNAVAPDGNAVNVAYLQAALDQEQKHAQILSEVGAVSPFRQFYFPAKTFTKLGYTSDAGTYLWVLDHLETAFIGAYLAAAKRFSTLERADLAVFALRILAVECQHRALYRVIAGDDPADNVTLEVADFSCVSDGAGVLAPFLTGRGFAGGATPAIELPTRAQVATIVGANTSS